MYPPCPVTASLSPGGEIFAYYHSDNRGLVVAVQTVHPSQYCLSQYSLAFLKRNVTTFHIGKSDPPLSSENTDHRIDSCSV